MQNYLSKTKKLFFNFIKVLHFRYNYVILIMCEISDKKLSVGKIKIQGEMIVMLTARKRRIMIVDDDNINIRLCDLILKKANFDTVSATSGRQCLDYLRNPACPQIDLILLDIEMPVLNGFNTLSSIRQSESLKHIPVMFLTATATQATVQEAIRLGVNSYLKKPFLPNELLEKVTAILGPNPQ